VIHVAVLPPLPARLPRAALMERLAELYARGVVPVENSVDSAAPDLNNNPSRAT
jgi:hypothetical protein